MSKMLDELAVDNKPAPTKRIRRSAEESRRVILDAAAKRLAEQGPEGIRLQDIARDVGISHPAILHHFESRAGLVNALVDRTTSQLKEKLLGVLEGEEDSKIESQMPSLVNNTFEALSDQGTAKLLSWMLLTDANPEGNPTTGVMTEIADRGMPPDANSRTAKTGRTLIAKKPCFWSSSLQTLLLEKQWWGTISMKPVVSETTQTPLADSENGWVRCWATIRFVTVSRATKTNASL